MHINDSVLYICVHFPHGDDAKDLNFRRDLTNDLSSTNKIITNFFAHLVYTAFSLSISRSHLLTNILLFLFYKYFL